MFVRVVRCSLKLYFEPRTNPVQKPPRTAGEYGMLPMNDTEMHDYGPSGYHVTGDRYNRYRYSLLTGTGTIRR